MAGKKGKCIHPKIMFIFVVFSLFNDAVRNVGCVVLRIIFGPKRDAVIGGWRKLHDQELHNLCDSPSTIRMIK
jgi:hypothetical protein